jgi:hypothetical protein
MLEQDLICLMMATKGKKSKMLVRLSGCIDETLMMGSQD